MEILDFKGSMYVLDSMEGNDIFIKTKNEKVTEGHTKKHDYNLHFFFSVMNRSEKTRSVNVFVNHDSKNPVEKDFEWIWTSNRKYGQYTKRDIDGKMNAKGRFRFSLEIPPNEKIYIANFIPMDYKKILNNIIENSRKMDARINEFGKSVEGRPLYSIELGDIDHKPALMFLTGYHPPEMDIFLIESIIDHLKNEVERKRILEDFSIVFVPLINPDGYHHRLQGSNVNEINFHWKFFTNSKEECPEAHHLWDYCKKIKPIYYMDFHMFTFQNKKLKPYKIPPLYLHSRKAMKIQQEINTMLNGYCKRKDKWSERFFVSSKILSPIILATRLREEFGTITSPKFHLHLRDGEQKCREDSVKLFINICNIFRDHAPFKQEDIYKKGFNNRLTTLPKRSFMSLIKMINFKMVNR